METLKNIGVAVLFVALLGAMCVGSALDIGRVDPFTGDADEDLAYCNGTPPSLMNEEELEHCDWLRGREDAEREHLGDFATDAPDFPLNYDDDP